MFLDHYWYLARNHNDTLDKIIFTFHPKGDGAAYSFGLSCHGRLGCAGDNRVPPARPQKIFADGMKDAQISYNHTVLLSGIQTVNLSRR